ncbi:recombinase family protein [Myxococcota bacterium]|nr:recombinase family protein [Myxococcota bacterium]
MSAILKAATTKPVRAVIYARVSTSSHGQDVGLQVEELRRVAQQRGWEIVGEFVDEGVSGGKASRPALDLMMKLVREGGVDVVAVWRFDRAARSTTHLLSLLEEFRQVGVDFISVREAVDTSTATGKMVFTFLAAVAEFEKALIVERVQAGVRRAKAQGKHCGRPRRDVDLDLARTYLDQGHGIRRTAKLLGVPKSTLVRHLGAG